MLVLKKEDIGLKDLCEKFDVVKQEKRKASSDYTRVCINGAISEAQPKTTIDEIFGENERGHRIRLEFPEDMKNIEILSEEDWKAVSENIRKDYEQNVKNPVDIVVVDESFFSPMRHYYDLRKFICSTKAYKLKN